MSRIPRIPARLVYAAAVLGSLAFGATQAFAAPPSSSDSAPRWCDGPFCEWREMVCVCW